MELATPQQLSALIKREKETLLAAWEKQVRQIPGAQEMKRVILRDHIPMLIDEAAEELAQPEKSREHLQAFATAHGENRYKNGFDLKQVVEEYKLLRSSIIQTAENAGLYIVGEAHRIVEQIIDEGIKTSIQAYVERRDKAEKKRREEYLKFLVHDLRSPLSAIYYAILLAERELETTSVSERIWTIQGVIKRNLEQMQALITKLLQEEENVGTSPNIRLERTPTELVSVADSAIHTLGPLATVSETQIVNNIPEDVIVNADRNLLERVFQNLISNAIDSTPQGRIIIGAAKKNEKETECWISDNGKGIPADLKEKVFERFVSLSRNQAGVGLGLPITKKIIEAHGGKIALESEVDKGTTIRFSISE